MLVSTCCGAETNMEEIGICPDCLEHCDFEEIDDDTTSQDKKNTNIIKDGTPYPYATGPIDNGYKLKINTMKQTAVEWLKECLDLHLTHEQKMQYEGLFQQAKQMEKEQIIKAHLDCWGTNKMSAEHYYNKTYGNQGTDDTTSPNIKNK